MKTELLQCRRLTVGLVYVPYPLEHHQVNRIYADVTEKYPFQNMQHLPDGGRMFNPNCDFFVQTTRMQVNENVEYFGASREKTVDLFTIAQARLNVPQFTNFGIQLTAFLPLEGDANSADILERAVLKSVRADLALLGPGRRGVGLRVVLHKDGVHEVKIEPFFGDLKQLYVELDVQHPNPFNEIRSIEPKLDAAYGYVFHEVRDFLETLEQVESRKLRAESREPGKARAEACPQFGKVEIADTAGTPGSLLSALSSQPYLKESATSEVLRRRDKTE